LTVVSAAQYSLKLTMRKRLTALFLLLLMAGGTLAGAPLHAGEKECPMAGRMDCCARARMKGNRPGVKAARLCCALNCTGPGTTPPAGSFQVSPQFAAVFDGALVPRAASLQGLRPARSSSPPGYPRNSSPAYIRHLTLLI
jgi:hypothetical protein